jgi:hypothetical protein
LYSGPLVRVSLSIACGQSVNGELLDSLLSLSQNGFCGARASVLLYDAVIFEVVTKLRSRDREGGTQVLSTTFSTLESVVPSPCSIRRAEGLPPDWLRRARL